MEIKNLQTFIIGEGSLTKDVFLTLDLIPIHAIFKYDLEKKEHDCRIGKLITKNIPSIINDIYTIDVYSELVNMICELLGLEERDVFYVKDRLPKFNFNKDEYFYEFQYNGTFGRDYYTLSKLRNCLKTWEQFSKLISSDEYNNKLIDSNKMCEQFDKVYEHIIQQGIFTNRDYFKVSDKTLNKFIKNLKSNKN